MRKTLTVLAGAACVRFRRRHAGRAPGLAQVRKRPIGG